MRKYLFYCILIFSSCTTHTDEKVTKSDCDKFRRGTFLYKEDGSPTVYRFERSDSIQTEFLGGTQDHINLSIAWTDSCTYELSFLNQHMVQIDTIPLEQQGIKVKVTITGVRNDSCFIAAYDGNGIVHGIVYIDKR